MAEPTLRELIDSTGRPRRKPTDDPSELARMPQKGVDLANAELSAALLNDLDRNPIAKLAFDPSRTTHVPLNLSVSGMAIADVPGALDTLVDAGKVPASVRRVVRRRRPDLGSENMAITSNAPDERRIVLLHEFLHLGFDKIRRRSDKPITFAYGGVRFREEDITRLVDFQMFEDREAVRYFARRGIMKYDLPKIINSKAFKTFMQEALQAGISNE